MRQLRKMFACLLLMTLLPLTAAALEQAADITTGTVFSGAGLEEYSFLYDGVDTESVYFGQELQLDNPGGIAGISVVFDYPVAYRVRDLESNRVLEAGEQGFLHCFSDLEGFFGKAPASLKLEFPQGAMLCELRVYSSGQLPDTVQQWQKPHTGGADIVLFSTHGDDEQLYFAGLLPHYAAQEDLAVQVVYMTDHRGNSGSVRMHEMLNGLWAVGIRAYPVFGHFPDFKLPYREHTYQEYENLGYSREELLEYVVENLRRFRPQVAVGHDLNGEYGHGMHKVYADLLTKAVAVSNDPEYFPDSAERYGVWDVPKTYLHLYKENPIVMDFDQPLDAFDGLTAFQVCQQRGYPCHISQQYGQYVYWLYGPGNSITSTTQITHYNPAYYGLYRSTVGEDTGKKDMMENLISYAAQSQIHEAEMARLQAIVEEYQLARQQESQLLREPDPVEAELGEQPQESGKFPVAALVLALLSVGSAAALFRYRKIFEK